MKENILTIKYSDDFLLSLKESKKEFEETARFLLALKLYELRKVSSGKAAKLCGLSRVEFLMRLKQYEISPFQMDLTNVAEEFQNDKTT